MKKVYTRVVLFCKEKTETGRNGKKSCSAIERIENNESGEATVVLNHLTDTDAYMCHEKKLVKSGPDAYIRTSNDEYLNKQNNTV